jgi:REP element-mobilizing transposase RayT
MYRGSSLNEQIRFSDPRLKRMFQFGGSLLKKSNAKSARPLSTKHAVHVVLSSSKATGEWSLRSLKNQKIVERVLKRLAKLYGIKIYEFGNVGNHVHILIKLPHRKVFSPFIRALSGTIALKATGSNKLSKLKNKFWDQRPWTRIVALKRNYSLATDQAIQNHLIRIGFISEWSTSYRKYFSTA